MIRDLSKRDRKGQALYVGTRPRNGRWTQQQGFTLIELMITLAISAILLSVAAPAYQSFIGSTALTTATNDLVAALNMARSEALKRDGQVSLRAANIVSDDFADGYCLVPGKPDDWMMHSGIFPRWAPRFQWWCQADMTKLHLMGWAG